MFLVVLMHGTSGVIFLDTSSSSQKSDLDDSLLGFQNLKK
ncbi:MAG: hypothetical protein CM15mP57_1190 [Alphaproteobacteria bacterium]|nr:MAG: hypothetical protein CM15mP57_1190 [Alphaproteobacteria bacterium]